MDDIVAQLATDVKDQVAQSANDTSCGMELVSLMAPPQNARQKQPRRPHFIPEWAERKGYESQTDLVKALDADKSVVSRWYSGASPSDDWQKRLVDLFQCEEPDAIFRHPDDYWLSRFFKDRSIDEIERAKQMLEAAFPGKRQRKQ